jgi:hypothetical protein
MKYQYKLISTGDNSNKYGNCEVCNKFCSEVFHQIEQREFLSPETGKIELTHYGCRDLFGHKDCLISKQRRG